MSGFSPARQRTTHQKFKTAAKPWPLTPWQRISPIQPWPSGRRGLEPTHDLGVHDIYLGRPSAAGHNRQPGDVGRRGAAMGARQSAVRCLKANKETTIHRSHVIFPNRFPQESSNKQSVLKRIVLTEIIAATWPTYPIPHHNLVPSDMGCSSSKPGDETSGQPPRPYHPPRNEAQPKSAATSTTTSRPSTAVRVPEARAPARAPVPDNRVNSASRQNELVSTSPFD
jgi:hypothetical protein